MNDNSAAIVVESIDGIRSALPALDKLARSSVEQNPFYEPFFLLSWIEACGDGNELFLVAKNVGGDIVGFLPSVFSRVSGRIPLKYLSAFKTPFIYTTVPLIAEGYEGAFWQGLSIFVASSSFLTLGVRFDSLFRDGSTYDSMKRRFLRASTSYFEREVVDRFVLNSGRSFEDHMGAVISRKHRKDLDKKLVKLSEELGGRATLTIIPARDSEALTKFLELERSGWKGKEGGAIACSPSIEKFVRLMAERGGDRISIYRLGTSERAVAMMYVVEANSHHFGFKIAFNESFTKFSPGLLLVVAMIRHFLDSKNFKSFDSCAAPGSELFRRVFIETRSLSTTVIGSGSLLSKAALGSLSAARSLWQGTKKFRGAKAV